MNNERLNAKIENREPGHLDGELLARNTFYNLIGYLSPIPVALITIPILVKGLGTDSFGVLAIAWMVIGYFTLFDMGIGRATTKFVAEYMARGEYHRIRKLVTTALTLLFLFGIAGGGLVALLTGWMVNSLLNIPPQLVEESRAAFYLLALSIPLVLLITGTRGVLEAQQKFGIINAIKIPSSLATLLVPLMVLPFSKNLFPIVGMLVVSKLLSLTFYSYYCWKNLEKSPDESGGNKGFVGILLRYGGWLSISNLIGPMMGNLDRFFIGSILTMTAVTYYVASYDMITRCFVIPIGILGVLFPAFSAYAAADTQKLVKLYKQAIKYILIVMTPLVIAVIVYARPFLLLWLGQDFADQSAPVLQILAVGVLFSSVARVPFNAIQAIGRPDITAKLQLIELPFYWVALYLLTKHIGIPGVAVVWAARLTVEMFILNGLIKKHEPFSDISMSNAIRMIYIWIIAVLVVSYAVSFISNILIMSAATVVLIVLSIYLGYKMMLDHYERSAIVNTLAKISNFRNRSAPD